VDKGDAMNLDFNPANEPAAWLAEVLAAFSCQTGTLHRTDGDFLALVAQVGVPEFLLPKISRIPFGKGIAGAAAERREPVELCNLQQDLGGVARPDARETRVAGSLAVPVFSPDGSQVLGTLGIGMRAPHDFSEDEKARLSAIAASVGAAWITK
jgi:putative methionine-R-sulfoxide reductase with GAF domain